jgi:hypothetical protein
MQSGTRVPGTNYQLYPIWGVFDIGTIVRWLDLKALTMAPLLQNVTCHHRLFTRTSPGKHDSYHDTIVPCRGLPI